MKTVSLKELHTRLMLNGLSPETSYRMIMIQDWYLYKLGLQNELHFPEEEIGLIDNEIGATSKDSIDMTYDPLELETYFIYKLRISDKEARTFSKVEQEYLEELGIM